MVVKSNDAAVNEVAKLPKQTHIQFPIYENECVSFYRSDTPISVSYKKCDRPYPASPLAVGEKSSSACSQEGGKQGVIGEGRKGSMGSGSLRSSSSSGSLSASEIAEIEEMKNLEKSRQQRVWEAYLDRNVEFRSRSASSSSTGSDLSSQYGSAFTPRQEITKDYLKLQSRVGELEVETAVLKVKVERQLSRISEGTPTGTTYSLFEASPSGACEELVQLKQQVKKLIKKTAEVKVNLDEQVSREEDPDEDQSEQQEALVQELAEAKEELADKSSMVCPLGDIDSTCQLIERWKETATDYEKAYVETMEQLEFLKQSNNAMHREMKMSLRAYRKKSKRAMKELMAMEESLEKRLGEPISLRHHKS